MEEESKRQRKSQGSTIAEIRVWNTYLYGSFSFQLVNKVGLSETKDHVCVWQIQQSRNLFFLIYRESNPGPLSLQLYPLTMNLSEAGIKGKSYALPGPVGPVVGSSSPTGHKSNTSQNWFWQNVLKKSSASLLMGLQGWLQAQLMARGKAFTYPTPEFYKSPSCCATHTISTFTHHVMAKKSIQVWYFTSLWCKQCWMNWFNQS